MSFLNKLNFTRWESGREGSLKFFVAIFIFLMLAYFLYHLITGDRGLVAYSQTKQELARKKSELISTTKERERLQNKVNLMSNESLDLDMLEEVAKSELGYTNEDEVIYWPK